MHVPGWLLLIIISYLTERSMILKYKGCTSTRRSLPGSSPQGVYLGNLFFIIKFNGAAMRPPVPRPIWPLLRKFKSPLGSTDPPAVKLKFVDDLSILCNINLSKEVILDPVNRPRPFNHGERTGHVLSSPSTLQLCLDELESFANSNLMRINDSKTCLMKFSKSRSKDFPPEFAFQGKDNLKVVNTTKLLGVMIDSNLGWETNTNHICKKASSKLWLLRRMNIMGLDYLTILDYYIKEVRSHLELAVPAWHSNLTLALSADIERVQRMAVGIILGTFEYSYEISCTLLGIEPLYLRRITLCTNFAKKTAFSPHSRHKDLFLKPVNHHDTRVKNTKFIEHSWNRERFYKSPLPFLTRLLNNTIQ